MSSTAHPPEIQDLLDKQAIRDLLAAYFTAADRHDNVKMAALYHEDATDDHGSFFKGLAKDFIATLPKIQEGMAILHHSMTTANIKVDGDYAEGEIYALAFHQ
ncbi:MAG: nuclear transport factor 2 family protein, partial [Gammaproteobacteria bacterium]